MAPPLKKDKIPPFFLLCDSVNYGTFNRKNKRPVHDLTPSICNMFAMCTLCREKREKWSLREIFSVQHAFRSEVGQDYGHPSKHWLENAYYKK